MNDRRRVAVDLEALIEVWSALTTISVSLAELGRWEGVLWLDGGGLPVDTHKRFLREFDVTRKLLDARLAATEMLEPVVGDDFLEDLGEQLAFWKFVP